MREDNLFICIDLKGVDSVLQMSQEAALEKYLNKESYSFIHDAITSLEGWACFKESKAYNTSLELDEPEWEFEDEEFSGENYIAQMPYRRETPKVDRNDPCHCGSGKKYKKCCAR